MFLTAEYLQENAPQLGSEIVDVTWTDQNGQQHQAKVNVIEMTVAEKSRFEKSYDSESEEDQFRERLVIAVSHDGERKPIFSEEHLAFLSGIGSGIVEPIIKAASKLNGSPESLEETGKNSETTSDSSS